MRFLRTHLPALLFILATLTTASVSAKGAVCPWTYLFELNGQHYYSMCECDAPYCNPNPINGILVYDALVHKLGCKSAKGGGTAKCECRTLRIPISGIEGDLNVHHVDSKKPFQITNDDFVVTQFGSHNYYFRTLTFSATNSESGEIEKRSVAIPLTQKRVTELAQNGNGGQPVVFKESTFDGKKVALNGTAFKSVATKQQIPQLAQLSSTTRK